MLAKKKNILRRTKRKIPPLARRKFDTMAKRQEELEIAAMNKEKFKENKVVTDFLAKTKQTKLFGDSK